MVVTRKQAAESGHPPHSEEAGSPDISPDSNLNLLASSASCEALSAGVGWKTPGSSLYTEGEQHAGHILTDAAASRLEHDPSSTDDSTVPRSVGISSATEVHGSASHITFGPAQSSVPAIVVMSPASSSSSQTPVQGTAPLSGQLWTVGDGEKAGVGKQYKIVYKTLKPLTSSAPMVLGVSSVFSPPAQPAPPLPHQVLLQADPGTTSQRMVVPGSHTSPSPSPSQPPARAASLLGSSTVAVKTPGRSSAMQSAGSAGVPASRTVIFVSSPPPPLTVGSVPGSASSSARTSPPRLLPAGGTSSLKPAASQALSSLHGVTPGSAAGVVSHTPSLPEPGVSHTAALWSGQTASTPDPHTGHSAPAAGTVTVSTSSPLMSGHSVSQALFQLAHTAKAELMGHIVSNSHSAQTQMATPVTVTGQGLKISNAQIPPVTVPRVGGVSTLRVTSVPGPLKDSTLSTPMVTAIPEHTQTSTVLAAPSFPSTQPSASLTAASDGSAHLSMPLSTLEGGGGGGSGLGEGEAVTWDRVCTLGLIQLYKEHQVYLADPHYKKKSVWELIASKLRQTVPDGPPFRWNHVENKWKNMTKKFRDCVNVNRRSGTVVSKCNFFDEIAAIYNYSPAQDQHKAAGGLRALKSTPHKHTTTPSLINNNSDSITPTSAGECSGTGTVGTQMQNGSSQTDSHGSKRAAHMEDVPLVKKKKYAHLDGQLPSCSRPVAAAAPHSALLPPPPPPPAELKGGGGGGGGVDVVGVLQRLREDRARQEQSRMERLEKMHQEKMAMFGRFLAILQQARPPDKE